MKILIKNAIILTMDDKIYENGQVFIEDENIIFVGKNYEGNLKPERIINATNKLIMPGFINAHAHTGMTILKNISDDTELDSWLYDNIIPLEKGLDTQVVYDATMLGILEYLRNGITTFCDCYYSVPSLIKAVKNSGIRANICIGFHPNDARKIEDIEEEYLTYNGATERVNFMLYSHSIYANDEYQITALVNLAHKLNLPLYAHISETLQEVSDCNAKNDLTPPDYLEKFGLLDLPAM